MKYVYQLLEGRTEGRGEGTGSTGGKGGKSFASTYLNLWARGGASYFPEVF